MLRPFVRTALTLLALAWFLPTVDYSDWITLILMSVVFTILQKVIRPILNLLFLPINVVTFGLFSMVLTVGILWLATYLVPGFVIQPMTIGGVDFNYFFSLLIIATLISFFQAGLKLLL